MPDSNIARLKHVTDFQSLITYLRDELDWPIEAEDAEDITFDYEPRELGIEKRYAVKIRNIKQIRPLTDNQPWGIFYLEFESKRLPVVVLRRILRALVPKKRASTRGSEQAVWNLHDLLFISAMGEEGYRRIAFAHFRESGEGIPQLQTFSWDERETHFFYLDRDIKQLRWLDDESDVDAWREHWASAFRTPHRYVIRTSKELSEELAKIARRTRDIVQEVYSIESKDGPLHNLYESFRKVLIHDLDIKGFANMVAQTIAYGLFSARATGEEVMGLAHLEDMIPNTNTFLRELFAQFTKVSGHERDRIDFDELGVSELVNMLNSPDTDMRSILMDFGRQTGEGREDPVVNFYELFLKEYDKKQKVQRGIFYTPKPVVSFIVHSVDEILKKEFGLQDGLADSTTWGEMAKRNKDVRIPKGISSYSPFVQILDPGVGTGTFLETVIEVIHDGMTAKWRKQGKEKSEIEEAWNDDVPRHLLPRLYGFELMMAPYAMAHMKLGLKLKETGYDFESRARLNVCLTNTLEEPKDFSGMYFAEFLAHEAEEANRIKQDAPITVVIGNPPYSVSSLNKGPHIERLMNDYKADVKKERNIQPLSDDYLKFIRFAHNCIEDTGLGVVAMITNNSYLSGVIHRGMRRKLLETFDEIYLLNLHGSARIGEKTPKGGKDENVFDIQQGVTIAVYVKTAKPRKVKKVCYADLWGLRKTHKYPYLLNNDVSTTKWQRLKPVIPHYFFVPKDFALQRKYDKFWKVTDIFREWSSGVTTHRDHFVVGFTEEEIIQRLRIFTGKSSDKVVGQNLNLKDTGTWKLTEARHKIKGHRPEDKIYPYAYRPFDMRFICYEPILIDRPRLPFMNNLKSGNIAFLCMREVVIQSGFSHIFITDRISDRRVFLSNRGAPYFFPLYICRDKLKGHLFDENVSESKRIPNFTDDFLLAIRESLTTEPTPEDIFYYVYAVSHAPVYRKRYDEFLKMDFPRIPLVSNGRLFSKLSTSGRDLVDLHLLRHPELEKTGIGFPVSGSDKVERVLRKDDRVYVNESQYFEGLSRDVWQYRVGAYQVMDKYLKDRKGSTLSTDEIEHYMKVAKAIKLTIKLQDKIDQVYPDVEKATRKGRSR